ncbi:MAG: GNAT family N-acetyltransferase [Actinomycetota bacterium]
MREASIVDIERSWATAERRLVDVVGQLRPTVPSMTFDLADGVGILSGPDLYVNQAMGAGLVGAVTTAQLEVLEAAAAQMHVAAAFDVCDATTAETVALLGARGYVADDRRYAMVHNLTSIGSPWPARSFSVERVVTDELHRWQQAAAKGWGHQTPARRAASDLYAAAAAMADDPGLMLCRDNAGVVVGVATLRIDGAIATLGGMSTPPEYRGRGVQSALLVRRLELARKAGCSIATSSVEPGSASHRNLMRHGFSVSHTHTTWVQPTV